MTGRQTAVGPILRQPSGAAVKRGEKVSGANCLRLLRRRAMPRSRLAGFGLRLWPTRFRRCFRRGRRALDLE